MKIKMSDLEGAAILTLLLTATTSWGESPIYDVPATANIYSAGLSMPVAPGGGGEGTLPISMAVGAGQIAFQFSASGSITENTLYGIYHGPDGRPGIASTVYTYGGISGFVTDQCVPLAGVFLSDSTLQDPAPPTLDFSSLGLGLDFGSLSPAIGQVFFIGDGVTSGGIAQTFYTPPGATRLFLGCPDSVGGQGLPGAYADNAGDFSVVVNAVPEPASTMLTALAAALSVAVCFWRKVPSARG